jgi:hypothetical protein
MNPNTTEISGIMSAIVFQIEQQNNSEAKPELKNQVKL